AKRRCGACGTDHFPRTEPVAIVLVTHGEDCLLGRGPNFPPGFMSALAGFAEAGETLEECAIREIHEEAGVRIKSVRYQFSQPWPFPASLMMGCFAIAEDKTLTLDRTEIEDARWVSRETLKQLLNGDQHTDIRIPPDFTIAHHLIKRWAEEA
ncbi:MAG: NAD(+) diphosphatase, partial [Pseudomonadota bacterium]